MTGEPANQAVGALRLRPCMNPSCNTMFSVCPSCDRGQRYCGDACRKQMRQRQVSAAGRRYQSSAAGKAAHCRRQAAYRVRRCRGRVTHQAQDTIMSPPPTRPPRLTECAICGGTSQWFNPMPSFRAEGDTVGEPADRLPSKFLRFRMIANRLLEPPKLLEPPLLASGGCLRSWSSNAWKKGGRFAQICQHGWRERKRLNGLLNGFDPHKTTGHAWSDGEGGMEVGALFHRHQRYSQRNLRCRYIAVIMLLLY